MIVHEIQLEIKRAILSGDKQYQGIPLPSPQTAGTYRQQESYAHSRAMQLYELHFRSDKCNARKQDEI